MKRYTIDYMSSLGSFLDEEKIEWYNNGNDTIDIICKGDSALFKIATKYALWVTEI